MVIDSARSTASFLRDEEVIEAHNIVLVGVRQPSSKANKLKLLIRHRKIGRGISFLARYLHSPKGVASILRVTAFVIRLDHVAIRYQTQLAVRVLDEESCAAQGYPMFVSVFELTRQTVSSVEKFICQSVKHNLALQLP